MLKHFSLKVLFFCFCLNFVPVLLFADSGQLALCGYIPERADFTVHSVAVTTVIGDVGRKNIDNCELGSLVFDSNMASQYKISLVSENDGFLKTDPSFSKAQEDRIGYSVSLKNLDGPQDVQVLRPSKAGSEVSLATCDTTRPVRFALAVSIPKQVSVSSASVSDYMIVQLANL